MPIIGCTADIEAQIQCKNSGMVDFLPKPILKGVLFSLIAKYMD